MLYLKLKPKLERRYLCTNIENKLPLKNVTFFGADMFSTVVLNCLNELVKRKLVVNLNVITSDNSKQIGNTSTIKKNHVIDYCKDNKIEFHFWENIRKDYKYENVLSNHDLGVVASFAYLLPSRLINLYKHGLVNIHPSLLPRWRGASPIHYTILMNDKHTGVSLMKILPKHFDIGPIIMQTKIETPENIKLVKLNQDLASIGGNILNEYIENFEKLKDRTEFEQHNEAVTYAHKITNDMWLIDWENHSCLQIDCIYRALNEISFLKTELNQQVAKLTDMISIQEFETISVKYKDKLDLKKPNGFVTYLKKDKILAIKCKDGFVGFKTIIIKTQKQNANDFNNGFIHSKSDVVFTSKNNPIFDNIHKSKI